MNRESSGDKFVIYLEGKSVVFPKTTRMFGENSATRGD